MREEPEKARLFEQIMLPHLSSAYNLARWLMGNDDDADDIVQDSFVRALKYFGTFRGGDARVWLLAIVRNTSYSRLQQRTQAQRMSVSLEEDSLEDVSAMNPEILLEKKIDAESLRQALDELPAEFKEVIVLRELEGMSYKEIAGLAGIPIGTVMSRLARARKQLAGKLQGRD